VRIFKRILFTLAGIAVVLAAIGFFLPRTAEVERSVSIGAPAEKIFPLINDFQKFNDWSPWARRDPNTEYRFEGPESGVGAKMFWSSDNPDVGSGSQEIVESAVDKSVRTRLDFGAQGKAEAYFDLTTEGDGTRVVWGFHSDFGTNLIGRYMGLMFDEWIGADYEAGLVNLKQLAEGG
jgi:hypothetical protein